MTTDEDQQVYDGSASVVNTSPRQLEDWLDSQESNDAGQKRGGGQSTGHRSGRRIVSLLRTKEADPGGDDHAHMKKVVGYVHRHLEQRPSDDVAETPWRYTLMNWGPPGPGGVASSGMSSPIHGVSCE